MDAWSRRPARHGPRVLVRDRVAFRPLYEAAWRLEPAQAIPAATRGNSDSPSDSQTGCGTASFVPESRPRAVISRRAQHRPGGLHAVRGFAAWRGAQPESTGRPDRRTHDPDCSREGPRWWED